jgi:hypothetical protein
MSAAVKLRSRSSAAELSYRSSPAFKESEGSLENA